MKKVSYIHKLLNVFFRKTQHKKAEIFHRFETLEKCLIQWKCFAKKQKENREKLEKENEKRRQERCKTKAIWFYETKILR